MVEKETVNIISIYAPQVSLDKALKVQVWEDLDGLVREIPIGE